jgi:hypothetical protein
MTAIPLLLTVVFSIIVSSLTTAGHLGEPTSPAGTSPKKQESNSTNNNGEGGRASQSQPAPALSSQQPAATVHPEIVAHLPGIYTMKP